MSIKEFKEKAINARNSVCRFVAKHDEAIAVGVAAIAGAFLGGYILGGKIIEAESSGYCTGAIEGFKAGQDSVYDELWENAAKAGGTYGERFSNSRNGRRIGVTVDLFPTKEA